MTEYFEILFHLFFTGVFGRVILSHFQYKHTRLETLINALMLGMAVETMLITVFIFVGLSLEVSMLVFAVVAVGVVGMQGYRHRIKLPDALHFFTLIRSFRFKMLRWYEWLLAITLVEKIISIHWNLYITPVYFDDTMNHWAGRARSLFGGVNWSFDPGDINFLAQRESFNFYPLHIVIWRAVSAVIHGSWSDLLARYDGVIFYVVSLCVTGLIIQRLTGKRSLVAAGVFVLSALPLQFWHAVAGYADIAVQAYLILTVACVLKHEWVLAGIFTACCAWVKNDALFVLFPAIIVGVTLQIYSWDELKSVQLFKEESLRKFGSYLLGVLFLAPWIIIKFIYGLKSVPVRDGIQWHSEALSAFFEHIIFGASHSIFWMVLFCVFIVSLYKNVRDSQGRSVVAMLMSSVAVLLFIFHFTEAYWYLMVQTTAHRSFLQLYGLSVVTLIYCVFLWLPKSSEAADK